MKSYKIQVNGKSYDVTVEETGATQPAAAPRAPEAPRQPAAGAPRPPSPQAAPKAPAGATQVKAAMPGTVLSFRVGVGQSVKAGDVILILEAMKMENEIASPVDGVVTALSVAAGASVSTGDLLATIG